MGSLDDISEAIGHLRGEMSSMRRTVEGMDEKVDVLGDRMVAVEQFKGRFEGVESTVQRHEKLVQRGAWHVGSVDFCGFCGVDTPGGCHQAVALMGMPPLSDDLAQEAARAYLAHDRNNDAAARSLGVARTTFQNRLLRAAGRGLPRLPCVADP